MKHNAFACWGGGGGWRCVTDDVSVWCVMVCLCVGDHDREVMRSFE